VESGLFKVIFFCFLMFFDIDEIWEELQLNNSTEYPKVNPEVESSQQSKHTVSNRESNIESADLSVSMAQSILPLKLETKNADLSIQNPANMIHTTSESNSEIAPDTNLEIESKKESECSIESIDNAHNMMLLEPADQNSHATIDSPTKMIYTTSEGNSEIAPDNNPEIESKKESECSIESIDNAHNMLLLEPADQNSHATIDSPAKMIHTTSESNSEIEPDNNLDIESKKESERSLESIVNDESIANYSTEEKPANLHRVSQDDADSKVQLDYYVDLIVSEQRDSNVQKDIVELDRLHCGNLDIGKPKFHSHITDFSEKSQMGNQNDTNELHGSRQSTRFSILKHYEPEVTQTEELAILSTVLQKKSKNGFYQKRLMLLKKNSTL
jgi:hypothetical protein